MLGLGSIGLLRRIRSEPAASAGPAGSTQEVPLIPSATLSGTIGALQARLRSNQQDWRSYAALGMAYVQQARVTADPSYYPKAQGVLRRSLALESKDNFDAMTGLAALAAARHDFAGALAWGERASAINAYNANTFAVIGDAQVELGQYPQAFQTFQRAIDLRPDLSTYARASYAWELQGSVPNAVRAMNLALQSAGTRSDAAWASNQLGELYWNSGGVDRAAVFYQRAAMLDPTSFPPRAGLAKVAWARGQLDRAIAGYRSVVARYPLPEYVIALGDLYSAAGRPADAAQQYALVHVEERLFQANGVNMDLEIALFDADHGVDLAAGLAAAQTEWARRQSVNVADALAWELFANGRSQEALAYADQALHLGTKNALFLFHRGMIERQLGRTAAARKDLAQALALNPHFSIVWSRSAAATLSSLGGAA